MCCKRGYVCPFAGRHRHSPPVHYRPHPGGPSSGVTTGEMTFAEAPPLWSSDGEEVPFAGHALEFVRATILELQPRPDHEVTQRAGHEHVVRPGQCAHPRSDVHGDAADVVAA